MQGKVQGLFARLSESLEAIEAEIQRCKRNLSLVAEHQRRLHGDEAIDQYDQAKRELEEECNRYLAMRQSIHQLVLSMDGALGKVVSGKGAGLAGGGMRQEWPAPPISPSAVPADATELSFPSLDGDVEVDGVTDIDL